MQAIPVSLLSWKFEIRDGGQRVCRIEQSFFRERGSFFLDGRTYTLGRAAGWGDYWVCKGGEAGRILASADKVSFFGRRFDVEIEGDRFELVPKSMFSLGFDLRRDGETIGTIRRAGIFTRKMDIDLPEDLPISLRVFLVWLVLMMFRRSSNSQGGS